MTAVPAPRTRLTSSLRWRLSLAISGLVLLCTALCVAAAVIFLSRALNDQATSDMQRTLTGVSGYLDNQQSDLLGAARLVAADPAVISAVQHDRHQALIVHLTPLYADLNADVLDVVDSQGRVVVRMEDTLSSGDNVGSHPIIQSTLAGNEEVAVESDRTRRQSAGGYSLRANVPIRSATTIVGAVVVGRQLDNSFAARIGHAVGANVNLIAGNQRTGTTVTDRYGFPATGLPEPAGVLARIGSNQMSIASVHEDGQSALSGLVPLDGPGGHPVGAVEVVRSMDSLYNVIRLLSLVLLALGALVVILGTLLALWLSRRLTSRLMVLEKSASQVASLAGRDSPTDDLAIADAERGHDEIASLARSFSAMVQALNERIAANARLYEAAQERVRELSGLAEIARLLTAAPSIHETVDLLGEHVRRLVGARGVAIWLAGDGGLPVLYGGHGLPEGYAELSNRAILDLDQDGFETTAQAAMRTGEVQHRCPLDQPVIGGEGAHRELRAALQSYNLRGTTAVPLRVKEHTIGALTCYSESPEPLPPSELRLLSTIADQVAVAVENARLFARSRDLAAVEERQRLARELHDSVSQALYGIALGAQTAKSLLEQDPEKAAEPLEYVLAQTEAGLAEMRALIFELRPEALESEGLVVALTKQAEALRTRHGLAVETVLPEEPLVPFAAKEAVFRIAQEGLHNIVKHAHATSVAVRLTSTSDNLALEITDDGKGFDPDRGYPGHIGLQTMRERAIRLRGTFDIDSVEGRGTRITVRVPVERPLPVSYERLPNARVS